MLNAKEKKIVGQIRYIALDKRGRLLIEDQLAWMEDKMKEIRRLVKKLPYTKFSGKEEDAL